MCTFCYESFVVWFGFSKNVSLQISDVETSFWIKAAANAYKKGKLVSYGTEEYEFVSADNRKASEWMYYSDNSLIADSISLNEKLLSSKVPVGYKDSVRGNFLLFGKLLLKFTVV